MGLVANAVDAGRVPAIAVAVRAVVEGRPSHCRAGLVPVRAGAVIVALHHGRVAHAVDRVVVAAVVGTGLEGACSYAHGISRCGDQ